LKESGVVMLAGSFPPRVCGVADYTAHLARSLAHAGVPVAVWTLAGETDPAPGVYPILSSWDRAGVRDLVRRLRYARPGLVHLQYERSLFDHQSAVSVVLPELLRAIGIPLVTTFHALDGPAGWGRAHRAALLPLIAGSHDVVVCSPRQQAALSRLPRVGRKLHLLPIGSGIAPVAPHVPRAESIGPVRLVYFGFLWPGRNVEMLLNTVAALPAGSAILAIIGGVRDADYDRALRQQAADLGIADRVTFHGDLLAADVSRHLTESDAAVLPFATGVSVGRSTLAAAIVHHLPVVTLSVPDNLSPEFRDGENLLLAPAGDPGAFIAAVRRVVEDAALRARLSEGAARLADSLFSWTEIARRTRDLTTYRLVAGATR